MGPKEMPAHGGVKTAKEYIVAPGEETHPPIKLAPELLAKASEHHEWEEFSKLKLAQGGDLRKYYPLNAAGRAEYEEWKRR